MMISNKISLEYRLQDLKSFSFVKGNYKLMELFYDPAEAHKQFCSIEENCFKIIQKLAIKKKEPRWNKLQNLSANY